MGFSESFEGHSRVCDLIRVLRSAPGTNLGKDAVSMDALPQGLDQP